MEVEEDTEVATVVVTEEDTVVATEVVTEEDMAAMEVAMEDMDTVEKREKLMLSLKLMLLLKQMPITVMEAMAADMVMADTEGTAMGANGDQLNPATDMVVTEEAMVAIEAMVDTEVMVVMEAMVAMDMVDMDIMDKTEWHSYHSVKKLDT